MNMADKNNADMILINGRVYSVTLDGEVVRGEAVAVAEGRILKVGTNDEIKALAGRETEVIDCQGNTILPGLCDVHCHPALAAASESGADLFGVYRQEGKSTDDNTDNP